MKSKVNSLCNLGNVGGKSKGIPLESKVSWREGNQKEFKDIPYHSSNSIEYEQYA